MKQPSLFIIFCLSFGLLFGQHSSRNFDLNGHDQSMHYPELKAIAMQTLDDTWTSVGPYGGNVVDLAIDPTGTGYELAAAGYPYYRYDALDPWMMDENLLALSPGGIHCVEINSNGILFAAGNYSFGKIFISGDGGSTWTQKGLPYNAGVLDIALDPSDPNVLYAGLSSNLGTSQNKVLVKSSDAGATWSAFDMTAVLPVGWSCVSVAIDPANPQTLFAIGNESFSNATVVASFDGGASWEYRTNGLPSGKPYNKIYFGCETLFICGGQLFGGNVMGVYKSPNYGINWQNISSGFPNKVANDIVMHPDDANKMYVATEGDGVYFTLNGGITWNYNTNGAGNNGSARKLLLYPGNPGVIYAGFLSLGVCLSNNGGPDWITSTQGIASLSLNDIEADPNDPQVILTSFEAENSGGCYLFNEGIQDWELVGALPATRFSAVDVGIDGTLYTWSNGPTTVAQEGIYKSTDGGTSWENMGPFIGPVFETQIWCIALSETDPDLIIIGGNNFGANGWASVIHRSTDQGSTWENVYVGPDNESINFIHIVPGTLDKDVYAAYKTETSGAGFMKSNDGGISWNISNTGIPASAKWGGVIVSEPGNPQKLLGGVGGYGGITGTIYISGDAGASWVPTPLTLGNYSKVTDILISQQNPEVIYAGTSGNGIYLSTDGGTTWLPSNEGMPAVNVTGFSRTYDSGTEGYIFYASTFTHSAFWTKVYEPGTTELREFDSPAHNFSVYPNPSTDQFNLQMTDYQGSPVELKVYTASGQIALYRQLLWPVNSTYTVNHHLEPGIYFVQVTSTRYHSIKKLLIW